MICLSWIQRRSTWGWFRECFRKQRRRELDRCGFQRVDGFAHDMWLEDYWRSDRTDLFYFLQRAARKLVNGIRRNQKCWGCIGTPKPVTKTLMPLLSLLPSSGLREPMVKSTAEVVRDFDRLMGSW